MIGICGVQGIHVYASIIQNWSGVGIGLSICIFITCMFYLYISRLQEDFSEQIHFHSHQKSCVVIIVPIHIKGF